MTTRHRHVCGCGDFLMCSNDPDKCPHNFQCPTCEQDARDEWMHALMDRCAKLAPLAPYTPIKEETD